MTREEFVAIVEHYVHAPRAAEIINAYDALSDAYDALVASDAAVRRELTARTAALDERTEEYFAAKRTLDDAKAYHESQEARWQAEMDALVAERDALRNDMRAVGTALAGVAGDDEDDAVAVIARLKTERDALRAKIEDAPVAELRCDDYLRDERERVVAYVEWHGESMAGKRVRLVVEDAE